MELYCNIAQGTHSLKSDFPFFRANLERVVLAELEAGRNTYCSDDDDPAGVPKVGYCTEEWRINDASDCSIL